MQATNSTSLLDDIKKTGVEIIHDQEVIAWAGEYGGNKKPNGPLQGKKIGLVVASEFSDWQAYYFAEYIGEYGGVAQFVMDNNHLWKETRPAVEAEIPHGMWGLSLTGGMDGLGMNGSTRLEYPVVMPEADPSSYDGIILLGGHSGDVLVADPVALDFIKAVTDRGVPVAAIGGGILPLIGLELMQGKRCTGDRSVDYMLKKIADFRSEPVVIDGNLVTGRDTVDAPAVLRALCTVFDPAFEEEKKNILRGKSVMFMIAEDWEDCELCPAIMEFLYRGAEVVVGLFEPEMKSRPALLGLDVRHGSYGTTVPFQEIPESYYRIVKEEQLNMADFDALFIPGAFNPWQLTVLHRQFLRDAYAAGKILGAICHGPIPLAAADLIKGRRMTGWDACNPSVTIMGGICETSWAAAIDGPIVTGKTPPEVPEFVDAISLAMLME